LYPADAMPLFATNSGCCILQSLRDTIEAMFHRSLLLATLSLATLGISAAPAFSQSSSDDAGWSRKFKVPPPSAHIEVTVTKAFNGKPVEDAAVIFHPIEGDKDKGVLELKTNEDGKAIIDVIPIGDTIRLQIIAHGYQTYGQDFKVDKAQMSMEIHLKRPGAQYSTYDQNSSSKPAPSPSPDNPSTDKPSGSGNPPPASGTPPAPDANSGSNPQPTPPSNQPK
jgi:hypothetical protein